MAFYDTGAKFKINENPGAGIVALGNATMKLGKDQLQHKKDQNSKAYKDANMKLQKNQDKRADEKLQLEKNQEQRVIKKLQDDKDSRKNFKTSTIDMFKKLHPKTTKVLNGDEDMIWAFTKSAGYDALQRGKKLKDTRIAPNNDILYIYDDGSTENSGYKSKDWHNSKGNPNINLTAGGKTSMDLQKKANEKRAKRLDKNID